MSDLAYRGWRQPTLPRNETPAVSEEEEIVREARERFRQITDWESDFRQQYNADVRFTHGDSDNHWQWPDTLFNSRDEDARPSLTVNKTRQHVLQIVNDAKMNKPQVRINPTSDEATKESADVFEGLIRHIEYASNATTAYDTATECQVAGGIGWWRIETEYEDDGFDQEIRIRRIKDPMTVYMDPDIQEVDGSDARYAFVVDDVPRDEFELKYPEYSPWLSPHGVGLIDGGWMDEDHVRVAEYWRKSQRKDTLHQLPDGTAMRESEVLTEDAREILRNTSVRRREIRRETVEKYLIVGGQIVETGTWAGKYIPLVRVIGEEAIIEGRLERKGHARALKDPQRIYNYWTSSGVESVALQSKTPWIASTESIENFQQIWDTANVENHPVLPYNARDDAAQPLPPPVRADPPQMAQAYIQGLQIAQSEMMMVSGQYAPNMGQPSPNEISGKAIQTRQRQGDVATYHYIDALATAIRFTGRILLDLIPKVYDTPRVLKILNIDGSTARIRLDPSAPQALTHMQAPNTAQVAQSGIQPTPQQLQAAAVVRIFNPNVGKYEVQADIGPNFQTKRQEAYNAFVQIVQSAPQMMNIAGDLLFKSADFPMADELAERLQRMVPPQALGLGPTPQDAALQQQLQGAQAHIALLGERLAVAEMKLKGKDEQKDIDAYQAVTSRLGTLLNAEKTDSAYATGEELRALIRQMVMDALGSSGMAAVSRAAEADIQQQMPPPPAPPPVGPAGPLVPAGLNSGQTQALAPARPPLIPGRP